MNRGRTKPMTISRVPSRNSRYFLEKPVKYRKTAYFYTVSVKSRDFQFKIKFYVFFQIPVKYRRTGNFVRIDLLIRNSKNKCSSNSKFGNSKLEIQIIKYVSQVFLDKPVKCSKTGKVDAF